MRLQISRSAMDLTTALDWCAWDGSERVRAFISRRVMDDWLDPKQPYGRCKSLFEIQCAW
jgi:hypothetical protein